jgi:AcrR family transcriptional regulator
MENSSPPNTDTKRSQILSTALGLFSELGFDAVSVRDLSTAAGVNLAMISYYFGSKEALLKTLIEERISSLEEVIGEIANGESETSLDKLKRIADRYIYIFLFERSFHQLLMQEISLKSRPALCQFIIDIWMRNGRFIIQTIKTGIKSGEFRKVDPEMMVPTIVGTVNQLCKNTAITSELLNLKGGNEAFRDPKLQKRISIHMHQLLESMLLPAYL